MQRKENGTTSGLTIRERLQIVQDTIAVKRSNKSQQILEFEDHEISAAAKFQNMRLNSRKTERKIANH